MAEMKRNDPAYWMLEKGRAEKAREANRARLVDPFSLPDGNDKDSEKWCSETDVYDENCYICRDPEYALMGLPLCLACEKCGGHVAADDSVCDDCGHDHVP